MIVKDRHGNILKYNQNGEEIGGYDDEPKKILNSSGNTLNIILLLCFILFLS